MNDIFNARSLSKICEKEYTKRFYPNNSVLESDEYTKEYNLRTYSYGELSDREIWGMLYSMKHGKRGVLEVTFQDNAHTLVVGTTQVGKTWGHVMDSVYALSAKKNKPSFMITDPKGEISENTVETLRKRGYRIYALNFKDTQYSNMWNPLLEIYDSWMELNSITEKLKYHRSLSDLKNYTLEDDISDYEKSGHFWSFGEKAYARGVNADIAIAHKKSKIESQTADLINQLVASLGSNALESSKEPCWQLGALEVLKGLIYLMLEDALDERSGFSRENMNFMNMQRYYEIIRESVLSSSTQYQNASLRRTTKLCHKLGTDQSIRHMRAYFENAPSTSRSYLGVFENIMQDWFNPKLYSIANSNNVHIDTDDEQPFAIFLITRDYEKSDYFIAGLFIDWVYKQMLSKAEANGGKLNNEMFFILDEFANIPVINSFTNKISTSLSRRIIFQLYVQSYEQIEGNYGISDAGTIRANCNVEIFLGSQSYKTKREFSEKCGTRRIKSLSSMITPDIRTLTESPAVSINALESLSAGDAYLKRLNKPVSKTHFEMAYLCNELSHSKLSPKQFGIVSEPYNDGKFVYKYLYSEHNMENFDKLNKAEASKNPFFTDI